MTAHLRLLIVNADDFGRTSGVNTGVIKGRENGIVTSASLAVRWPATAEAAEYCRANPEFGVGLHLDLGEWVFKDGEWVAAYEVVPLADPGAVAAEVGNQLETFRQLVDRNPTHVDSHQHVHRQEPTASVAEQLADALGVPLRWRETRVRYRGDLYGQTAEGEPLSPVTVDRLVAILAGLPPGITELACHPAEGSDMEPPYREEREQELALLCDPRIKEAIEREAIVLSSFADVERLP
jgi:chitin disaccharide deacetylase